MRIAIVYDAIHPYVNGGAERRYAAIARRLTGRGHEVTLVGWTYWRGPNIRHLGSGVTLHGVGRAVALHDGSGRRTFHEALAFAARCAPVLAQIDVDVIECSSIPYLPALVAAPIARARRIPLVVSWHEYMGDRWREYATSGASVAVRVERAAARVGDLRIAVSDFTRDRLPSGPRTVVINNGVDVSAIAAAQPEPAADVVLVGRLVPHKRVGLLLEALRLAPGVTAAVIGDGPDRGRLEAQAVALGVRDRVSFFGRIGSDAKVASIVKGARCALITSEQEGFAITVVEAMAAGVPPVVVSSAHSAARDLVTPHVDGLITGAEPREIAAALVELAGDHRLRDRLGERAAVSARAYDWDAIATQTETALERLVLGRKGTQERVEVVHGKAA